MANLIRYLRWAESNKLIRRTATKRTTRTATVARVKGSADEPTHVLTDFSDPLQDIYTRTDECSILPEDAGRSSCRRVGRGGADHRLVLSACKINQPWSRLPIIMFRQHSSC